MFCTGHTSMNINELVSYSALIKKEFTEEYKMVHGLAVKKGPGRAKVEPLPPSPSPSPSPCASPSTHTRRQPINPLARPLATDARLGGGEAGPDPSARNGLRGRQGVPWLGLGVGLANPSPSPSPSPNPSPNPNQVLLMLVTSPSSAIMDIVQVLGIGVGVTCRC